MIMTIIMSVYICCAPGIADQDGRLRTLRQVALKPGSCKCCRRKGSTTCSVKKLSAGQHGVAGSCMQGVQ